MNLDRTPGKKEDNSINSLQEGQPMTLANLISEYRGATVYTTTGLIEKVWQAAQASAKEDIMGKMNGIVQAMLPKANIEQTAVIVGLEKDITSAEKELAELQQSYKVMVKTAKKGMESVSALRKELADKDAEIDYLKRRLKHYEVIWINHETGVVKFYSYENFAIMAKGEVK